MKNLSFLKGLFVGIAIATVGGVVYANSVATVHQDDAWVTIDDKVYVFGISIKSGTFSGGCWRVPFLGELHPAELPIN